MDPKYDKDDEDLDATVRNLRTFADRPGDLSFRQSIAGGFEKVTDRLGKIEVRLARIDERQMSRTTVAEIVQKEIAPYVEKVATLSNVVWGLSGAIATALVALGVSRLFGK
jgi:hypothetical protein